MDIETFTFWSRLDVPGSDSAWVVRLEEGWMIYGAAVFAHENGPAFLNYGIEYDAAWETKLATIEGYIGDEPVRHAFMFQQGIWAHNGVRVDGMDGITQIDFGFTPATNYPILKKLNLSIGREANIESAWFDVGQKTISRLPQRFERQDERYYAYDAPRFGYSGFLDVMENGFVKVYPGLWEAKR